jgi:hypothetical protein
MVFMGFEGLMDSIKNIDAGVNGIYATGPRLFFLAGDTISMSMKIANYGFLPLPNAYFVLDGPYFADTVMDLDIGDEDSVVFAGVWVPVDTGHFDFDAFGVYPGDERPGNDTFLTSIYVQPLRQLSGNISDTINGHGVYARIYFQFADDTGAVYFDSTISDSISGDFSIYLIDSLYGAVIETRIPYPDLQIEGIYVTPDSISVLNIGTRPADLLVVNRDDQARYDEYYAEALDSLWVTYKVWVPTDQGIFPISRMDEFNTNVIIWYTGRAATNTVTPAEQDSLILFLNDEGKLVITGQNIGQDISSTQFYINWLHAQLINDSLHALRCYPDTLDSLGQSLYKIFTVGSAPSQYSRDVIASDGSAHEFFYYDTAFVDCAALWYNQTFPDYQIIYCGFGLEAVNEITGHMSLEELLAAFFSWFDVLSVEELSVEEPSSPLLTVLPNPVQRQLVIRIGSAVVGEIGSLKVYDITGRLVKIITCGSLLPDVSWYLDDERGRRLSTGVYFVELDTAGDIDVRKVVVVD